MNNTVKIILTIFIMVVVFIDCKKTDSDVKVTTYTPQDITATTAKCGGDVIVAQGLTLSGLGVCWSTERNPTVADSKLSTTNWNAPYVCTITNLEPSTNYHIRAFAIRGLEYYYGEDVSFTTQEGELPTVTTSEATKITANTATCGGVVISDGGGLAITERGICWGTTSNPTVDDFYVSAGVGLGSFSIDMSNLEQNTMYYVRAYAKNYHGISYGEQVSFITLIGEPPTVTTLQISNISAYLAMGGGVVVFEGSLPVTERGLCWSTTPNPTIDGIHESTEAGMGEFTIVMFDLERNTSYYVRAFAKNYYGVGYGEQVCFTTLDPPPGGTYNGHDYVDLGLPSGTLWATCNIGATSPDSFGDYFSWAETEPKNVYSWSTYKYNIGDGEPCQLTKYNNYPGSGYNGFTDNLIVLEPTDDAATVNWGDGWCMPSYGQWCELCQSTSNFWANQHGVNGRFFVANNGNILFLPATGCHINDYSGDEGHWGNYWSSYLYAGNSPCAWILKFNMTKCLVDETYGGRYKGYSVRPVRSPR